MKDCIKLKKLGGFYNVFDDDTFILYYLFQYKIKDKRSGFPLSAYNKVINSLEENNVSYIVEDKEEKRDFKKKNKYNLIVKKGKKLYEREK